MGILSNFSLKKYNFKNTLDMA